MKRLLKFVSTERPIEGRTKLASVVSEAALRYASGDDGPAMAIKVLVNVSKLLDISVKERNYRQRILRAVPDGAKIIIGSLKMANDYVQELQTIERNVYMEILLRYPNLFDNPEVQAFIGRYLLRPLTYNKHFLLRLMDIGRAGKYKPMSDEDLHRSIIDSGKSPFWSFHTNQFTPGETFRLEDRVSAIPGADVIISFPEKQKTYKVLSILDKLDVTRAPPGGNAELLISQLEAAVAMPAPSVAFLINSVDAEVIHPQLYDPDYKIAFVACFPDDTCRTLQCGDGPVVSFAEFAPKMFLASFPELKPSVLSYWLQTEKKIDSEIDSTFDRELIVYDPLTDSNEMGGRPATLMLDEDWGPPAKTKEFKYNVEMLTLGFESPTVFGYIENYIDANRY